MESTIFDNDKFITIVQNFPSLWDKSHAEYSDKIKKASAWKSVMSEMFVDEDIETWRQERQNEIEKDLQKRWKNLRNSFARELAKRKNCKSGSGRTWKTSMYFEQLTFLIPSMSHAELYNNLTRAADRDIDIETIESPPFSPPQQARPPKKRKTDAECDLADILSRNLEWKQQNEERMANDPDRLFLMSLLHDFKSIPQARKASVKMDIINAISRGLYFNPQPPTPPPPTTLPSPYASHILPHNDHSMYPTVSHRPHIRTLHTFPTFPQSSPYSDLDYQNSTDSTP